MIAFPYILPHLAPEALKKKIPFRVRMTFCKGVSDKWWELTFDPSESLYIVYCNHGRRGSSGRLEPFEYDVWKAVEKAEEKIAKGYVLDPRTTNTLPAPPNPVKLPPPFESVTQVRRVFDDGQFVWFAEDAEGRLISKLSDVGASKLKAMLEAV